MPRYRTLNNDAAIQVGRTLLTADPDGAFSVPAGSPQEAALLAGGAVPALGLSAVQVGAIPALSWRGASLEASPIWSAAMSTTLGKVGMGQDLLIPAGTLQVGSSIKGHARLRRTGTAGAITVYLTLGATNGTGDGQIFNYAFASGVADPNRGELNFNVVVLQQGASAAVRRSQFHNISNVGAVLALSEVASANFNNVGQDLYLGLIYTVSSTSVDTLALLDYNITLTC